MTLLGDEFVLQLQGALLFREIIVLCDVVLFGQILVVVGLVGEPAVWWTGTSISLPQY